jgi:hypothetical protein
MKKQWCIPPEKSCEFVAAMEDILEVYGMPKDPEIPLICMDEQPVQIIGDKFKPIEMKPCKKDKSGQPKKEDYEYIRNGTCSIFMFSAPLEGWRHVDAQERRTRVDWAYQIDWLLNESCFKDCPKIRLVMDNLNTHSKGSLYEAFPPQKALELARRLEIHYTPKHGSWLNMAEIELSVLTMQCLNRRINDLDSLRSEISAWKSSRNSAEKNIDWQFSTENARDKLKRLYPNI